MSPNHKTRRWKNFIFNTLLGVCATVLLANTSCSRKPEMQAWRYNQFVDQVKSGQVEKVNIRADQSQAVVIAKNGQQVAVNLPSDPELINILQQNNVDISVLPQSSNNLFPIVPALLLPAGIMLGGFLFWVWVLIDCATNEASEGNTKLVWVLIILFVNLLGAFVYFLVRRPQRYRELGQ
jgi:cell division protease FtsH